MPSPIARFMKSQGWSPIQRPPEGAACATCENVLDPEVTNYKRSGTFYYTDSVPYYCCHECARELYDEEGPAGDDDP